MYKIENIKKDVLNNLILNYLNSHDKKIAISDQDGNYSFKDFREKVFKFKNILKNKLKKKEGSRGIAILLERNVDYIAIIFAAWLSHYYYVPLSINSPKKNINYQIKTSNIDILVTKKKKEIFFERIKKKKK